MATGSPTFSLAPGAFLGAYRVLEPLAHNALGETYLARHNQTRRNVALTVVGADMVRPGLVEELRSLADIEHAAVQCRNDRVCAVLDGPAAQKERARRRKLLMHPRGDAHELPRHRGLRALHVISEQQPRVISH